MLWINGGGDNRNLEHKKFKELEFVFFVDTVLRQAVMTDTLC